jgi:hypothetical protein
MQRRAPTSITFSQRITRSITTETARLLVAAALLCCVTGASAPNLSAADLVVLYDRAMTDPGAPQVDRFEIEGTIAGAGLTGTFHSWQDGDNERTDQSLGLRQERTFRQGSRYFFVSSTGNVREYHGSLLRRARTQALIDAGNLSTAPGCCTLGMRQNINGRPASELVVTASGGDTESLFIDLQTGLPLQLAYQEDDGLTTIDFSDWRSIGGRRFAYQSVASDGNHAFDTTQITTAITLHQPIDPSIFAIPANRTIETSEIKHVGLVEHAAHLFVPVTIDGHPYTFLIDTGAQGIMLDERVVKELGVHEEGALEASGASRVGGLHLAKLDDLEIAGAAMHDLVVTTLDLSASTLGAFHIDGILGCPFFASADVRIDFAHDTMDFGTPGSLAPAGERIDADLDRGLIEIPARANDVVAPFMLDTGDAAGLLLYGPFVRKHTSLVPATLDSGRSFGLGGEADSYRTSLDRLLLGTTALYNVDTDVMLASQGAFADQFDAGNIGLGLLKNFVVTFDAGNGAIYLDKSAAFDDGHVAS